MKSSIRSVGLHISLSSVLALILGLASMQASAGIITTYEDYDDRNDELSWDGVQSTFGILDVINGSGTSNLTASGYGAPGDGTFTDNLGFMPGTLLSAQFRLWLHGAPCDPSDQITFDSDDDGFGCEEGENGAGIVAIDLNSGLGDSFGILGYDPLNYVFSTSTLSGSLLAGIDDTGQLGWEIYLFDGIATVDGVGLVVTAYETDVAVPAPSVITLFGIGLIGLGFIRRRKSQS